MIDDKQKIREYALAERAQIPEEDRNVLAGAAAGRLTTLPEAIGAALVLGYMPTAEEIDPAPALQVLVDLGVTVAYPRIAGPGALTLHVVRSDRDLEVGRFGIRQPTMSSPSVDSAEVDLVIVPGLAFDPSGRRIGYGGGYYDRLLLRTPSASCVGYAFENQLLGDLPHAEHDILMDVIVTPERVIRPTLEPFRPA